MGGRKSHFNFASVNTSSSLDEVKRNPGWPVQGMPRIPRCFIRATVMFSKNEMARWTIDLMGGRKSHFNFASVNTSSSLVEMKRNPG